jgi:hypothetical protein
MALNLERLQNKLEQIKNPGNKKFSRKTWKPKQDGEHSNVRLIQYPFGEDPFPELWFHYGIGNGPGILCPRKNYGKTCPICEFAISLVNSDNEADKEQAKILWPKQRMYAVVVDRTDAEPAPKYWGFGVQVYQQLLEHLVNPKTMHMLDPEKGIDLEVWTVKAKGKRYPETFFSLDRTDTPLADDPKKIQDILAAVTPIEEVYKPSTTSEIQKRLGEWSHPGDSVDAEAESAETTRGGNGVEAATKELDDDTTSETVDVEDINAEFERALANAE